MILYTFLFEFIYLILCDREFNYRRSLDSRRFMRFFGWAKNHQRIKHCVKSVHIRSYSGPHFPAFGLNKERYSVGIRENADSFYAATVGNCFNKNCLSQMFDMILSTPPHTFKWKKFAWLKKTSFWKEKDFPQRDSSLQWDKLIFFTCTVTHFWIINDQCFDFLDCYIKVSYLHKKFQAN